MLPHYPISGVPVSHLPRPVFAAANQRSGTVLPRYAGTTSAKHAVGSGATFGPVNEALRRNMQKFQVNDGVPVHLKGGAFDRLLFGATVGLCFLGVAMTFYNIYDMAWPKKK